MLLLQNQPDTTFDNSNEHAKLETIISEIEKVIVGKRHEIILLLTAMFSGAHVLIEDVPGTGKTSLAQTIAKVTGLNFKRAQFTPDIMASDITGFNIYNRKIEQFEFREGLVMCNLLLADEINRASPKTQSALLEAMEEGNVTVDGVTYNIPEPFMVIATQNPSGYVGTYPLPEAQLDRFALKIKMGYPSEAEEMNIMRTRLNLNPINTLNTVTNIEEIKAAKSHISAIHFDEVLYKYIIELISATRKHPMLTLGASPRASVALMHMSQAYAFIRGRNYVLPDDIAALFHVSVAHRLILKQEARLSNVSADDILTDIIRKTAVPYKGSTN